MLYDLVALLEFRRVLFRSLVDASVATQLTVVTPLENVEPLAGAQTTLTPGQLSPADRKSVVQGKSVCPTAGHATINVRQLMLGDSVSLLVTVTVQPAVFVY